VKLKKDKRLARIQEGKIRDQERHVCPNCGARGRYHFVPASLGEGRFYVCDIF